MNINKDHSPIKRWRPSKLDDYTVGKLEEAFKRCANVSEACFYAWIHRDTYYYNLNISNLFFLIIFWISEISSKSFFLMKFGYFSNLGL